MSVSTALPSDVNSMSTARQSWEARARLTHPPLDQREDRIGHSRQADRRLLGQLTQVMRAVGQYEQQPEMHGRQCVSWLPRLWRKRARYQWHNLQNLTYRNPCLTGHGS